MHNFLDVMLLTGADVISTGFLVLCPLAATYLCVLTFVFVCHSLAPASVSAWFCLPRLHTHVSRTCFLAYLLTLGEALHSLLQSMAGSCAASDRL